MGALTIATLIVVSGVLFAGVANFIARFGLDWKEE